MSDETNGYEPAPKLSELVRAVVHGLYAVEQLLRALVADNHPAVAAHPDTTRVLAEGPPLAEALEAIAQRLDAHLEAGPDAEDAP